MRRGVKKKRLLHPHGHPLILQAEKLLVDDPRTLDEISALSGYSTQAFYLWRTGRLTPRLAELQDILAVFGHELKIVKSEQKK